MVKCLNQSQKNFVLYHYHKKTMNQKNIATHLNVSERTVHRVLVQAGLATPVQRLKEEAKQAMALLTKYNVSVKTLADMLRVAHGY